MSEQQLHIPNPQEIQKKPNASRVKKVMFTVGGAGLAAYAALGLSSDRGSQVDPTPTAHTAPSTLVTPDNLVTKTAVVHKTLQPQSK